jgi:single-strand DNA-binding protein
MNEQLVTLRGWLGGDVRLRRAAETPVADFRLACTPARYDRTAEQWVNDETQWYTVTVWRRLADNCAASLRRGDPVIVHGQVRLRSYVNANGVEVSAMEVEATHVGHDLSRGTTVFSKTTVPGQPAAQPAAQATAAA